MVQLCRFWQSWTSDFGRVELYNFVAFNTGTVELLSIPEYSTTVQIWEHSIGSTWSAIGSTLPSESKFELLLSHKHNITVQYSTETRAFPLVQLGHFVVQLCHLEGYFPLELNSTTVLSQPNNNHNPNNQNYSWIGTNNFWKTPPIHHPTTTQPPPTTTTTITQTQNYMI